MYFKCQILSIVVYKIDASLFKKGYNIKALLQFIKKHWRVINMDLKNQAIGVFDSGLGGISVLKELKKMMPNENYIYFGDSQFAPYGIKTKSEITERCKYICEFFMSKGVKAIIIACNTATSACVNVLRETYKIPIIGMEPALKVAAQGKENQHILVMATDFTLKEKKFEKLMSRYSEHNHIYKQPCPKLVELVEHDQLDDNLCVKEQLKAYMKPYEGIKMDSIVLGCTHFVFYQNDIKKMIDENTKIIDGNYGTSRHVKEILISQNNLQDAQHKGTIEIYNSRKDEAVIDLSKKLLVI